MFIGTAAWNIPKAHKGQFPTLSSQLANYSRRLNAVEINSSFYRDHKPTTYAKWAECVPDHFRFSVKLSKVFTHTQRLKRGEADLKSNLDGILNLGSKLGCILVQLPPSLDFNEALAKDFFKDLRRIYSGPVALEPRHYSWNQLDALALVRDFQIGRVIADPDPIPLEFYKKDVISSQKLNYYRLHGSPEIYKSDYSDNQIIGYTRELISLEGKSSAVWCIFDNTTFGHATANALTMEKVARVMSSTQESKTISL